MHKKKTVYHRETIPFTSKPLLAECLAIIELRKHVNKQINRQFDYKISIVVC